MIIRGRKEADWFLVRSCISEVTTPLSGKLRWALVSSLIIVVAVIAISAVTFQLLNADAHKPLP